MTVLFELHGRHFTALNGGPLGHGGVNTIQKQHVKVNIEVQRTAKTLDQRHRASLRGLSGDSCFF